MFFLPSSSVGSKKSFRDRFPRRTWLLQPGWCGASRLLLVLLCFRHFVISGCHLRQEQLLHWDKCEPQVMLDSGVLCLCHLLSATKDAVTSRGCSSCSESSPAAGAERGGPTFSHSPPLCLSMFFPMTVFLSCGALPCRCHLSLARRRRFSESCRPPKTTAASPPQT